MTTQTITTLDEIWKPVVGYEGSYEVSDHGRVRSLDRVGPHWRGGTRSISARVLTPSENPRGYLSVHLYKGEKVKVLRVNRLVLMVFVAEPPKGAVGMHLDNNRKNNHLSNLRWGTHAENIRQRDDEGRNSYGEAQHCAKFTESQVLEIRALYAAGGVTQEKIATWYGVNRSSVGRIVTRKTWKHI